MDKPITYGFECLPVVVGHLGRSLVDHIVDAVHPVRLEKGVDRRAVLRVLRVHVLADVLHVGLHVGHAVDELLEARRTLLVVWRTVMRQHKGLWIVHGGNRRKGQSSTTWVEHHVG